MGTRDGRQGAGVEPGEHQEDDPERPEEAGSQPPEHARLQHPFLGAAGGRPAIWIGVATRPLCVGSPSWPWLFRPHPQMVPSARSTRLWLPPAAMATISLVPGKETTRGIANSAASLPSIVEPHCH